MVFFLMLVFDLSFTVQRGDVYIKEDYNGQGGAFQVYSVRLLSLAWLGVVLVRCKWHVFCCRIGAALNEDKIVLFLFSKSKEAYGCIHPTGQLPMGTTYQGAKTLVELSLSYKSSIPHESTFPGEMQEALSDTLCAFIVKDSRCF